MGNFIKQLHKACIQYWLKFLIKYLTFWKYFWLIKMWTHLGSLIIFYINLQTGKNMQLSPQNDVMF